MKTILVVAIAGTLLFGCGPKADLNKALVGEWETKSLRINYETYKGGDTSHLEKISQDMLEQAYSFGTTFKEGGEFTTSHQNHVDSTFENEKGNWEVSGDSLFMIGEEGTVKFEVKMQGDKVAEFRSLADWDEDGEADDEYFAIMRRKEKEED